MDDHTISSIIPMSVIAIIFAFLKILNIISWPWIWVFAPVWIPLAIAIIYMILAAIFGTGDKDGKED